MSRLVIDTYHVTLVDENGRRLELVPGKTYQFSTPTSLVTRLQSTRSGNNAWWSCGEKARTALNKSPYQPVIRAIVQCFRWMPPGTKDNRRLFDYDYDFDSLDEVTHGGYVVQGGTGVLNWFTVVVEPVPDPLSGVFDAVAEQLRGSPLPYKQGHLEVGVFSPHDLPDGLEQLPGAGGGYRRLYNHHVYPLRAFAWRVIQGTAWALAAPWSSNVYITSHQHEDEWLELPGGDFVFVLRHPIPRPQRGVD